MSMPELWYAERELMVGKPLERAETEEQFELSMQETRVKFAFERRKSFIRIRGHSERLMELERQTDRHASFHTLETTRHIIPVRRSVVLASVHVADMGRTRRIVVNDQYRDVAGNIHIIMDDYAMMLGSKRLARSTSKRIVAPAQLMAWELDPSTGPFINLNNRIATIHSSPNYAMPLPLPSGIRIDLIPLFEEQASYETNTSELYSVLANLDRNSYKPDIAVSVIA